MPVINVHGAGGGNSRPPGGGNNQGPGIRPGPSSQIPYMRPNYDQAWNSNQQSPQPGTSDWDKAVAQREEQDRKAAASQRQRQTQSDAVFRKTRQQADQVHRQVERDTRAEIRLFESGERAKARAVAETARARRRDEQADIQIQRRQGAERERRIRAEMQLGRQVDALQYKAGRPVNVGGYDAVQRNAAMLRARGAEFQNRYGYTLASLGRVGGALSGMGGRDNTYVGQNIDRLGSRGQRSAEDRSWVGLARVEQELKRIERVNLAMLSNDVKATAEQKINAQRNIAAVGEARGRISAGRSGSSPMMNAIGTGIGATGLLLANPLVDLAATAVMGAAASPFIASSAAQKALSLSTPYYNIRERSSALGRAGNFRGTDFENTILPREGGTPDWMKSQGITTDMAFGILGDYGVSPTSASDAKRIVRGVRSASLSDYMGLSDKQLASSAGLARTLGVIGGDGVENAGSSMDINRGVSTSNSMSQYFATMQKVMASATSQGLDHSASLQNVQSLLQLSARSAMSVDAGGLSNFWHQMTTSGLPSMRSGEGVLSTLQGLNKANTGIGIDGDPAQNIMYQRYFERNGGVPTTSKGLQSLLGYSDEKWSGMMGDSTQRSMIDKYLENAKSGNMGMALTSLSPLLDSRTGTFEKVLKGSGIQADLPSGYSNYVGARLEGITQTQYAGWSHGQKGGLPSVGGDQRLAYIRDHASRVLGISTNAAAGLVGNLQGESGVQDINEIGKPQGQGGGGWAQWTGPRRERFEAYKRAHPEMSSDEANQSFMEQELQTPEFSGVLSTLRTPGIGYDQASDAVLKGYENPRDQSTRVRESRAANAARIADLPSSGENIPTDAYHAQVNADQTAGNASRYAAESVGAILGGPVGDVTVAFTQKMNVAVESLAAFITELSNGTRTLKYQPMRVPGVFSGDPDGQPFSLDPVRP